MAFIYKITNDVNGKVYIGKTTKSVEKRWKEHFKDSKKERCKNRPLYRAMNKYGVEHFSIETIEQCTDENASESEKYWISYYRSFRYGYNATCGGDGKIYANRALVILLWLANKNIKFISWFTGYANKTVRKILENIGIDKMDIVKRASKVVQKPVDVFSLDGNYIRTFASVTEAANCFKNKDSMRRHISDTCRGKRKTAGGYKWHYSLEVSLIV